MKIFLLLIICVASNLDARDVSHFAISVGSFDQPINDRHTKVHFIVTDSSGRKTGFKSFFTTSRGTLRVNEYREIPNSSYGVDQIGSADPSVVPDEPESAALDFFRPVLKDTYTIQLAGIDDCKYFFQINFSNSEGKDLMSFSSNTYYSYIVKGTTQQYILLVDPTPGAPVPVITKVVTFDVLRNDVFVAQKLTQLGDDKFADSLVKNLDLAEKLSTVCDKRKSEKEKCEPAIAVLKLFIKRLELANRKCDNPDDCDEEREWAAFRKEHGKDDDFKDFFRDWDAGDWHKHKKSCKRFVTDEALKIITEDAKWLIKSLGGEIWTKGL